MSRATKAKCPNCGSPLQLHRTESLIRVECDARCPNCKWAGRLILLRCGGCHADSFFLDEPNVWKCIQCGHLRTKLHRNL